MRITATVVCPILMLGVAHAQNLPEGKGKQLVEDVCGNCHGLDFVLAEHGNKERWASIVNQMVARGATGSDEDLRTIVEYLAKNFPAEPARINVNKATAKEIETALELSAKDSEAIVQYRTNHGDYKDLAGMAKVPGIDSKILESRQDRILFK
jgi:competence ComEA-like helix-hairpin-helix protein